MSDSQFMVVDEQGRGCEIVQSRCERRRAQNRKAQRAYRARRETQLKEASSTLAEKQSQLRTATYHNRELVETIKQLKAIIDQLEVENQLLKEVQSPDVNEANEPFEWMWSNPQMMAQVPTETTWESQNS